MPQYNFIAPFAPGTQEDDHHFSSDDFSLENYTNSLFNLINDLQLTPEKICIVAHDTGGAYAHELLKKLSAQTPIICINTMSIALFQIHYRQIKQALKSFYFPLLFSPLTSITLLKKLYPLIKDLVYKWGKVDASDVPKEYQASVINGIHFYRELIPMLIKPHSKNIIENKALFIIGRNDPFIEVVTKENIQKFYGNFQYNCINAGHWPHLEKHKLIAKKISQFLEGIK